jgi:hypothetical protein
VCALAAAALLGGQYDRVHLGRLSLDLEGFTDTPNRSASSSRCRAILAQDVPARSMMKGTAVVRITHDQSIGKYAGFAIPYDYLKEI